MAPDPKWALVRLKAATAVPDERDRAVVLGADVRLLIKEYERLLELLEQSRPRD